MHDHEYFVTDLVVLQMACELIISRDCSFAEPDGTFNWTTWMGEKVNVSNGKDSCTLPAPYGDKNFWDILKNQPQEVLNINVFKHQVAEIVVLSPRIVSERTIHGVPLHVDENGIECAAVSVGDFKIKPVVGIPTLTYTGMSSLFVSYAVACN
jgi:hypothetical protein